MLNKIASVIFAVCLPAMVNGEEFLELKNGNKYLGNSSKADPTKFIICGNRLVSKPEDAKVVPARDRQCPKPPGPLPSVNHVADLIVISEGAAQQGNMDVAKEAIAAAAKISARPGNPTSPNPSPAEDDKAADALKSIEMKAGADIIDAYRKRGNLLLGTKTGS